MILFSLIRLIEALLDPKTWLFFLFAAVSNLQNGISIQYSIIIKSFGFQVWQTTLLAIPNGAVVSALTAVVALPKKIMADVVPWLRYQSANHWSDDGWVVAPAFP